MKYSALIRKLVKASEECAWAGTDIADILKERCTSDKDIIRQTLMNAVCDPRFRMHIGIIPSWRQHASQWLGGLAEQLESVADLTESVALVKMDERLDSWIDFTFLQLDQKQNSRLAFETAPTPEEQMRYAVEEFVSGQDTVHEEQNNLSWLSIESETDPSSDDSSRHAESDGNKDSQTMPYPSQDNKTNKFGIGGGAGMRQKQEQTLLTRVPPTLIELARRIGRSTLSGGETNGKFLRASKSDIAGIMTGNDLNCILPSELALMAAKQTENIFYKNYVTRSLQLFASASYESHGKKHHDGPIIICLDTSSSMHGEPMAVAAALTFAICIIAQRRKRPVVVVKYSNSHEYFILSNLDKDKKPLLAFLSELGMGGNDENGMFKWLFGELLTDTSNYQNGDVLCVSDFGWMPITQDVMEIITRQKKNGMKFYGLNVLTDSNMEFCSILQNMYDYSDEYSPKQVCDSLWEYHNGICRETWQSLQIM